MVKLLANGDDGLEMSVENVNVGDDLTHFLVDTMKTRLDVSRECSLTTSCMNLGQIRSIMRDIRC